MPTAFEAPHSLHILPVAVLTGRVRHVADNTLPIDAFEAKVPSDASNLLYFIVVWTHDIIIIFVGHGVAPRPPWGIGITVAKAVENAGTFPGPSLHVACNEQRH
jgi:hypothetical protein